MLKVIDLDAQGREGDGLVFTLTIGNEKFGITDQELVEMIRAKHGGPAKAGAKRVPQRRGAQAADTSNADTAAALENTSDIIPESDSETSGETQAAL